MGDYARALASTTRPANTTAYAANDLIANDATAGNVVPFTFNFPELNRERNGKVVGLRLQKSVASVTNFNVRMHLFSTRPTVTNGDNGALLVAAADLPGYIGFVELDFEAAAPATVTLATTTPTKFSAAQNFNFRASGPNIYGLLEALEAYTPASAEIFTAALTVDFA